LDVKILFSDEESEEIAVPKSPRRPNILHSSSFDDPSRMTSNLSTKNRYENDISNIDDYQVEEQRRRLTRQNQIKISSQSKRTTSRKKSMNINDVETNFDGSELISSHFEEKKIRTNNNEGLNLQKPKQPKKERSLTENLEEVQFYKELIFFFLLIFEFSFPLNRNILVVIHLLQSY
jgi:lipopolysaccharide export LptBFGC system permease protein LptF